MRIVLRILGLTLLPLISATAQEIDWKQPPVGCIEEFVAQPDQVTCLDLSGVANPLVDFPADLTLEQMHFWNVLHRPDLSLCRAKEVLRREEAAPGSQTPVQVYVGYMRTLGGEKLPQKIEAMYQASTQVSMPPQILFGALFQESVLAELMIEPDGGNYSCGIAQMNLYEWCMGMQALPLAEQIRLGWPTGARCWELKAGFVAPLHEIAVARGKAENLPVYRLRKHHYAGIRFEDVESGFPGETLDQKKLFFQAATSFTQHCSDYRLGIFAKARELRRLFDQHVPEGMKTAYMYAGNETFQRRCRNGYPSRHTPLHPGWLLADATYNAGGRQVDLLAHYFMIRQEEPAASTQWASLSPLDIIEGLHWGGKYNPATGVLEFLTRAGSPAKQTWFKSCVVQRHIARVIQYVSPPGVTIARSLEQGGCVRDSVPIYRQQAPGVRILEEKQDANEEKLADRLSRLSLIINL